jgi:BNR/Asp-box repeat
MKITERHIDEVFETSVRSALRRAIVPPSTPEYLRYRIADMSAATIPASRGPSWPQLWVSRRTRRYAVAVRVAAVLLIAALVVTGGAIWNSRPNPAVAAPTFSGPVFDDGAVILPEIRPNGVAFSYVDGKGLYLTSDFGATWSSPRQIPAGNSVRDHLWDIGTIDFADGQHGWMTRVANNPSGSSVVEYRTTDGALTWTPTTIATFSGRTSDQEFVTVSQHFSDALNGRLILAPAGTKEGDSSCRTFVTVDGGATWAGPTVGSCLGRLPEASWMSGTLGFAHVSSSGDAAIRTTTDGGATWVRGSLQGTWVKPEVRLLVAGSDGLAAVVQEAGGDGSLPVLVMRSTDGGRTWLRDHDLVVPRGGSLTPLVDLSASSQSRWVGAFEDEMMVSDDGGRTWTALGSWFFDAQGLVWWDDLHGIVRGVASRTSETPARAQTIFVTDDGGRSWRAVTF